MVDALLASCILKMPVRDIGPALPPVRNLAALLIVKLAGLVFEALGRQPSSAAKNVRVVVPVVAVFARLMDRNINGHAVTLHKVAGEFAHQL